MVSDRRGYKEGERGMNDREALELQEQADRNHRHGHNINVKGTWFQYEKFRGRLFLVNMGPVKTHRQLSFWTDA